MTIGQEEQFSLKSGNKTYYKLVVGPELSGKTLTISLNSSQQSYFGSYYNNGIVSSQFDYDEFRNDVGGCPIFFENNLFFNVTGFTKIRNGNVYMYYDSHSYPIFAEIGHTKIFVGYSNETRDISVLVDLNSKLYSIKISKQCYNTVFRYNNPSIALNNNKTILNGLYVSYNNLPSTTSFDYGISTPDDSSQYLTIPSLRQGTYYFMATASHSGKELFGSWFPYFNGFWRTLYHGDRVLLCYSNGSVMYIRPNTSEGNPQSMRLLANIVDFEIIDVNTAMGSNTGSVTTKVTGARFDTIMDFRLTSVNGTYPASKIQYVNPSEA